ncbi:DUF4838 domain-containing protein [Verrucomicrobiota bacterium]
MKCSNFIVGVLLFAILLGNCESIKAAPILKTPPKPGTSGLILVQDGKSLAPIVIFKDAPPYTKNSAYELADFIEKISGVKPAVIEGQPDPLPEHAIWVGFQPVVKKLFPKINFNFKNPEEILLTANANHLLILGRDKWDPSHMTVQLGKNKGVIQGKQQEYGTANAVYTFLQDSLGVRWLWPGPSGEDILKYNTIAFTPFEYRYFPKFLSRSGAFSYSSFERGKLARKPNQKWCKYQRVLLDSLYVTGGLGFSDFYSRFRETKPELFALQPDGTRFKASPTERRPGRTARLCQSNPEVWDLWLAIVEEQLKNDPNLINFSASPNDNRLTANCVCDKCVKLDQPDARPYNAFWKEGAQEYVCLTDRYITFVRHLADKLKKRFPDKNYTVDYCAYGTSRDAPLINIPPENILISFDGNFPWYGQEENADQRNEFAKWAAKGFKMIHRPAPHGCGWDQGLPLAILDEMIDTFRFLSKNNCIGLVLDMNWEHWATQGPTLYLMGKLSWNPDVDGHKMLEDYYNRGFGPAASEIKAYWKLFEKARNEYRSSQPRRGKASYMNKGKLPLLTYHKELFTPQLLAKAEKLLDKAMRVVADDPKYSERIKYVRSGLDYTKLQSDNMGLMNKYLDGDKKDLALADKMRKNWDDISEVIVKFPANFGKVHIFNPHTKKVGKHAQNLHPDYVKYKKPKEANRKAVSVELKSAEDCGWELAFDADFKQGKLGDEWKIIDGQWKVKEGTLRGGGLIVLDRPFAKDGKAVFQRLEFKAATDVEPILSFKGRPKPKVIVSDMSSFIQAKSPEETRNPIMSGYFFQFGGFANTINKLMKVGKELEKEQFPEIQMIPGKLHHIIVQNDCGHLSMYVDGQLALDYMDESPVAGPGQDRVGLYFYTAASVHELKVYTKEKPSSKTEK